MAPALQTSKRKFYKLLDSLTTAKSTTSLNSSTSAHDLSSHSIADEDSPPAKRRVRPISYAAPSSSIRLVHDGTDRLITSSRPTSSSGRPTTKPDLDKPGPNYTPWSPDTFLTRLQTYSNITRWTPKPSPAVSEVAWARRGWVCDSNAYNTVACKGGCEARVAVRLRPAAKGAEGDELPDSEDMLSEVSEEVIEAVARQVIEGHKEGCLWRRKGCGEDIYRIRMGDVGIWGKEVRDRYWSVMRVGGGREGEWVPEDVRVPEGHEVDGTVKALPNAILFSGDGARSKAEATDSITTNAAPEINKEALTLALFGWQAKTEHTLQLLHCTRCFARQGLWLLTSKKIGSLARAEPPPPPMPFRVVDAHHEHCPWVSAVNQAGVGSLEGLCGWEVLEKLVQAQEERRRGEEAGVGDGLEGYGESDEIVVDDVERKRMEKEREGRLKRLKRVFTVRKGNAGAKAAL